VNGFRSLHQDGFGHQDKSEDEYVEFALRAAAGMISEILKQYNNTGLYFEFISDTKGCDLKLDLSYEGKKVKDGRKEKDEYVKDFYGSSALIAFGGGDVQLWKGVQTTGTYTVSV
jgi:hypothetical protein